MVRRGRSRVRTLSDPDEVVAHVAAPHVIEEPVVEAVEGEAKTED